MLKLRLRLNPPFPFFLRSVAVKMSPWRRQKRFKNGKIRLFSYGRGRLAALFSMERRAYREMLRRGRKKETLSGG